MDDLYDKLLIDLECPVCKNYLRPPIRQCATGHSVCQSCRTKLSNCPLCKQQFIEIRNITLEALASKMQYPCINRSKGCEFKLNLEEIHKHETKCSCKSFKCVMERCAWTGKVDDILAHCYSKHFQIVKDFNISYRINVKSELYSASLVKAHGCLFWFKRKIESGKIYWALQFIGSSETATNYSYEIEIVNSCITTFPRILFTDYCQAVFIENDDLFNDAVCITASIDCLGRFVWNNQHLQYTLRVHKVE